MKRGLIIGLAVAFVIALGGTLAFAESTLPGMMDKGKMNEMHKSMVEQHIKDGVLTPEQVKSMDEHMANMGSMMSNNGGAASCHSNQQNTNAIPQQ